LHAAGVAPAVSLNYGAFQKGRLILGFKGTPYFLKWRQGGVPFTTKMPLFKILKTPFIKGLKADTF
jgi:hypothetical protein